MSNLVLHAESELARMGMTKDGDPNDMNTWMAKNILQMVEVFSDEGHSEASAGYAISLLERLLRFEPLQPLTGEDSEWMEVGGGTYQNKRCSHVFKEKGEAYDIDGKIFREPDGSCFTNFESRVPVTFPYTPKREYVDRPATPEVT